MAQHDSRTRRLFWATFTASLALHAGLAAYLLIVVTQRPGAVPQPTTAISVNLETTDVLDAIEVSASADAASASASAAAGELEPLPQPAEALPEALPSQPPETLITKEATEAEAQTVEVEPSEIETKDLQQSEDSPLPPPAETTEAKPETKPQPIGERQQPRDRPDKAEQAKRLAEQAPRDRQAERNAREKERQAASQAASAARGAGRSQASAGRVSASTGDIRNYGAIVRARIARNKPGGGSRGSVVIALSISTSGSLTSARIVRSSGSASLDQNALAAVRRAAPFPPPPSGAAPGQLRFTIPFQFR
jgi:protein TonB